MHAASRSGLFSLATLLCWGELKSKIIRLHPLVYICSILDFVQLRYFLHDLRNYYEIQTFYGLTIPTYCTAINIAVNFESSISIDIQVFYFQCAIYCGLRIYKVNRYVGMSRLPKILNN